MPRAKGGKRRNKVSFKLTKEFVFLMVGLVILVGLTIFCLVPTKGDKLQKEYTSSDASTSLSSTNCFSKISYSKLMKKVEKNDDETFFVFYSTGLDSNCITNIVTLNSLADTYNVDKIYILDAKEAYQLDSASDDYYKDLAKLEAKQDELNTLKAGNAIDDIDLQTYSQLWAFAKDSATGKTELVFSTQTILDDKYISSTSFEFAVKKCFSAYAGNELAA